MEDEELQEQETVDQGQPSSRSLTQSPGGLKQQVSEATANAAKATKNVSRATKIASKGAKATGKTMKAAGEGLEKGGKAVESGGKAIKEAGTAAEAGATAAGTAAGAAIGGVGAGAGKAVGQGAGKVANALAKIAGTGVEAGGKGMQSVGKGLQTGGKSLENASKSLDEASKRTKDASKRIEDFSKKIDQNTTKGLEKGSNVGQKLASKAVDKIKELITDINPLEIKNKVKNRVKKALKIILSIWGICAAIVLLIVISILGNLVSEKELTTQDDAMDTSGKCIGNVKPEILIKLEAPVNLEEGQFILFNSDNNYGYSGTHFHNGLDLDSVSTNTKEGDPVYSVYYNGEVIESTADGTYSDENVTGGWVKIKYAIELDRLTSDITIIYGGLSKESLTLKKGNKVEQGQEIGKVGTASESEDGKTPGLHFGFYDNISRRYLNPVNLFIPCYTVYVDIAETSSLMVHEIGITRSDFITATTDYLNSYSGECTSMKSWDLGDVYDISVRNNINPELVVIRALEEGCSPYSKGYTSYNNYWGIGCFNSNSSLSECYQYSSFEEGIKGFANLNIIKNSTTIEEMMSEYAYLGDFWYNPGDSGHGGCYYYSYIKDYLSSSRSSEVALYCSDGHGCSISGYGSCQKTTEEDRNAYLKYQCRNMNSKYDTIYASYHINSPGSIVEEKPPESYTFTDEELNTSNYKIINTGISASDYAELIKSKNLYRSSSENWSRYNTSKVFSEAYAYFLYYGGSTDAMSDSSKYTTGFGTSFKDKFYNASSYTAASQGAISMARSDMLKEIRNQIDSGKPVIIQVNGTPKDYVTVIGYKESVSSTSNLSESDLLILDNYDGKMKALSTKDSDSTQYLGTSRYIITGKDINLDYDYYIMILK